MLVVYTAANLDLTPLVFCRIRCDVSVTEIAEGLHTRHVCVCVYLLI